MKTKQIYISDTIHGTIVMSPIENVFLSSTAFNRLHDVSQNSTAYLTFPTNRTKRFEHSLGTMKLCGDMFYHSICNSTNDNLESFFRECKTHLEKIIDNEVLSPETRSFYRVMLGDDMLTKNNLLNTDALREEVKHVFYNEFVPRNIKKEDEIPFLILFQAIRLAALLHDIGHPPYSHITESTMKNVYDTISKKEEKTDREEYFCATMRGHIEKGGQTQQLHESLGSEITDIMIQNYYDTEKNNISFHEMLFFVFVSKCVLKIFREDVTFFNNLHRVIDGSLDGDRLDYISRDVINSGIRDGIIEYDRLLHSMMMKLDSKGNYIFAPDVKAISTVENVYSRRWRLYKNIIYHHRVAKTDSLLSESIKEIMIEYLKSITPEERNEDLKSLPYDISGLWKAVTFVASSKMNFDKLSQWNDSWLITILKNEYFKTYYNTKSSVTYKLDELISNKKHYYSLIKNEVDFDFIANTIKQTLELELEKYLKEDTDNLFLCLYPKFCNDRTPYLEIINAIFAATNYHHKFYDLLQKWTREFFSKQYSDVIAEVLTIRKVMTTGLQQEPHVIKRGDVKKISEVCKIKRVLESESLSPYFYIYVRYQRQDSKHERTPEVLQKLGESLASKILEEILNQSNVRQ